MAKAANKTTSKTTSKTASTTEDTAGKPAAKPSAKPEATKPAATKPASKSAAKPAAARTASKTTAKAPAAKPAAAKSATAKSPTAKPAATKSATTKSAANKSGATKSGTSKSTTAKSAAAKPSTAKPAAAKPAAAKAASKTAAKPAAAKTAARKSTKAPAKGAAKGATKGAGGKAAGAGKPWLSSYPASVPAEIGELRYSSLAEMIEAACKTYGDRPAFTSMDKAMSFTELEKQSKAFAAYLQSRGLKKGDRVAIMMPNVLQYPVALAGILRAGMTVVNINPLYTPRELEHQLKDSGATAIIILENFAHTLEQVIAKTDVKNVVVAAMGDMLGLKGHVVNLVVRRVKKMVPAWSLPGHEGFKAALKAGEQAGFKPVKIAPSDIAFLQYTGGTTGVSKGAVLSHANVLSNVQQNDYWVNVAYETREKPDQIVYICALPLYHIFALTVNALIGIDQGGNNVLIANPRDIPAFVKEMKKYEWHFFAGLNTLFNALLNNEDFRKLDFKEVRLVMGGGMAVQRPVADRWKEVTGHIIYEGYGLSETSPVATVNRFDATEFSGTIGIPLPSTDVVIRGEDGKDLPLGEVGEICIRGPQVMEGYWNRPDETAKVMTDDGFFRSGDMGIMDKNGYVKIVDRKKDMILVSGFNVYPNEVEEVAASHPGIVEAAAIGVEDEKSGEVVKLFVVRRDDTVTEEIVKKHCAEGLTNYKRPKYVEFRNELPKTNVGKILRRELR